jgi:hypothetical protein
MGALDNGATSPTTCLSNHCSADIAGLPQVSGYGSGDQHAMRASGMMGRACRTIQSAWLSGSLGSCKTTRPPVRLRPGRSLLEHRGAQRMLLAGLSMPDRARCCAAPVYHNNKHRRTDAFCQSRWHQAKGTCLDEHSCRLAAGLGLPLGLGRVALLAQQRAAVKLNQQLDWLCTGAARRSYTVKHSTG